MKPVGGRVTLSIDGDRVAVRGNVTSNIGQNVVRETQGGTNGPHGFSEIANTQFIEVDVTEVPEFDLAKLNGVKDATVNAELADGRTLVLRNAAQVGELTRNADDGSIGAVRFEGLSGDILGV